jgi:acyl carrier protein
MTDSVAIKVKQVLADVLDIDLNPADIDDILPLYSSTISLDSLTLLHVITELERAFSCEIDDEAVMSADLVNVGSLVELVLGQLQPSRADGGRAHPAGQGADT